MRGSDTPSRRSRAFWLPWVTLALGLGVLLLQAGGVRGRGIPSMMGHQGALPPGQGGVIPGYDRDGPPQSRQARPTVENQGEVTNPSTNRDVNVAPAFRTLPQPVSQPWNNHPDPRSSPSTPHPHSLLDLPTPLTRTLPPALAPQGLAHPPGADKGGSSTEQGPKVKPRPPRVQQVDPQGSQSPSPPGLPIGEGGPTTPNPRMANTTATSSSLITTAGRRSDQVEIPEPTRGQITEGEVNHHIGDGGGGEEVVTLSASATTAAAAAAASASVPNPTSAPLVEKEGLREKSNSTANKPVDEHGEIRLQPPDGGGSGESLTTPARPWKPRPTIPASGMVRGAAGRGATSRSERVTELSPVEATFSSSPPRERPEGSGRVPETTPAVSEERQNRSSLVEENVTHAVDEVSNQHHNAENRNVDRVAVENVTDVGEHLQPQQHSSTVEGGGGRQPEGNQTEEGGHVGPPDLPLVPQPTKTSKDDIHKATTLAAGAQGGAGTGNSKLEVVGTDHFSSVLSTHGVLRPTVTAVAATPASIGISSFTSIESSSLPPEFHPSPIEGTTGEVSFTSRIESSEVALLDSSLARSGIPEATYTPILWSSTRNALQTSTGEIWSSARNVTVSTVLPPPSSVNWSLMVDKLLSEKLLGKSQKPLSDSDTPESLSHWDGFAASDLRSDLDISSVDVFGMASWDVWPSFPAEISSTPLLDSQTPVVRGTQRVFSSTPLLSISPTATRGGGEEMTAASFNSELMSPHLPAESRGVVEPTPRVQGQSNSELISPTASSVLEPASRSVPIEPSVAAPGVSAAYQTSSPRTDLTAPVSTRPPPGESAVTSPSSTMTDGAELPTGDHEIILHNCSSSSTSTPNETTTTTTTTTSGSGATGEDSTTASTSPPSGSPAERGASPSSGGGGAGCKGTTLLPPTSHTPPPTSSSDNSTTAQMTPAALENSTEAGTGKDEGKSPKPPGHGGSTTGSRGSSPDLGPGVTTTEPSLTNDTEHGVSASPSLPVSPSVAASTSLSPSSPVASARIPSSWTVSSSVQERHSTVSEQPGTVTVSPLFSEVSGVNCHSSISPSGSVHTQGTPSFPGSRFAHSSSLSGESLLPPPIQPTPSLPGRSAWSTQGVSVSAPSQTAAEPIESSFALVTVEATVTDATTSAASPGSSSSSSSSSSSQSVSVTTENPAQTRDGTLTLENSTTTTAPTGSLPPIRTLPDPHIPSPSPPSPPPFTSPPPSTPSSSHSTPTSSNQTARTVPLTSPTHASMPGVSRSSGRLPLGPPTTTPTLAMPSTPPPVFLLVKLQMTWRQFCQQQDTFRSELSQVLRQSAVRLATVNWTQIVLMNAQVDKCVDRQLFPGQENQVILLQLYFLDSMGQYDLQLTMTSASLIKAGFLMQDTSVFKDRLLDVRLSTELEHRPPPVSGGDEGARGSGSLFPEPGTTIVAVIGTIGAVCCVALVILQVALIRRRYSRGAVRVYVPEGSHYGSSGHSDVIALASVTKPRPHSGLYNPTFNASDLDLTHPINAAGLARVCQDMELIQEEFQSIPNETPPLTAVPAGAEDKNRYANVIPIPETRVKLRRRLSQPASDYINANFITGHREESRAYIATQAPLEGTVADLWRMVWEQQSRALLMLTPMDPAGKPQVGQVFWPESEMALQRYGDFRVALKKRDVTQEYIHSILELKEIETNLVREVQHFWLTCWPMQGEPPQPLSLVKFVLDTRPSFQDSGAPVVVMCSAGTGRSGVFIATDICMRQFEARRVVDILNCVHRMRRERAGMVQTRDQYTLIYQALNEYASILTAPGHQAS